MGVALALRLGKLALAVGLAGLLAVGLGCMPGTAAAESAQTVHLRGTQVAAVSHKDAQGRRRASSRLHVSRTLKLLFAVLTIGPTDAGGGSSHEVDVTFTVTSPTPKTDGITVYLTRGGCLRSLDDANTYMTNEFIAGRWASVSDGSVASYFKRPAQATPLKDQTSHAMGLVKGSYSTVCLTMWHRQFPDPAFTTYTKTPYFTLMAPLHTRR